MRALASLALGLMAALPAFAQDPAPRALSEYSRYELRDIAADVKVHPKVMAKLTTELKLRLDDALARWNADGAQPGRAGALAVEVSITDMKFVSGGKRFFAGALAGGSHCAATARLVDVESGQVVATENFTHKASSMAGSFSIGATDNAMLDRLATSIANWTIATRDGTPLPAEPAE